MSVFFGGLYEERALFRTPTEYACPCGGALERVGGTKCLVCPDCGVNRWEILE